MVLTQLQLYETLIIMLKIINTSSVQNFEPSSEKF
jgi:hypothetical protein